MELFIVLVVVSYLLGSFNSAIILIQSLFGKDIRDYGSGNAGATNVFRTFGAKLGFIVFFLDGLKGLVAVHLVYFYPNLADLDFTPERIQLQLCFGVAAMIGHILPLYHNFKGGKGVATVLGIILGINIYIALGLLIIFIGVVASTSYISLGSIIAALAFPAIVLFGMDSPSFLFSVFAVQITLFVVYSHRKNILRILKGEENKFILRRKDE